jgi:hypothetical protein
LSLTALSAVAYEDPAPTQEQQTVFLGNIAHFIENYVNTLPNLVCLETTEQYKGNKNGDHWKQGDTLSARLTLVKGREHTTLERVNNIPVQNVHQRWKRPLTTEGEFGDMLAVVLSKGADAQITWNRWETINGKHVAVFDYAINREHSSLRLSLSDLAQAVLPYSGFLFADPDSGTVWRVTDHVTDIPKHLQTLEMQTTLDYGEVEIAGKTYVLPTHATVFERSHTDSIRNEITFSNYNKFEAESTVKFDSEPK